MFYLGLRWKMNVNNLTVLIISKRIQFTYHKLILAILSVAKIFFYRQSSWMKKLTFYAIYFSRKNSKLLIIKHFL